MKVGFYDAKKHRMTEIEPWTESLDKARAAACFMTSMYISGRHRMPSPIWCVWDSEEVCSVFLLDEKPRSDQFLDKVMTLMV